jgi:aryl-alcohol dehydrogenase-like predicted oxidoreductase
MEYNFLGNTGTRISEISFGTQTFGWNLDESGAHELLDYYYEQGGNYLDSADKYNSGESERILGSWLARRKVRDNLVIGTKVFFPTGAAGANDQGHSRKHIMQSVNESLERLQTDYIDLYQLHCFDESTPLEETIRALEDLLRMGKIRYFGLSNFTPSQVMKVIYLAREQNIRPPASLQLEYSLQVRSPEWELLPVCHGEGIGTLAWSPLAGGWLTGKYRRDKEPPKDSRVGRGDRWDDQPEQRASERTWRIIDALVRISERRGVPASQVALNWLRLQKWMTAPIVGARNLDQLKANLGTVDWELTDEEFKALDEASAIETPSPYDFIQRYTRHRSGRRMV